MRRRSCAAAKEYWTNRTDRTHIARGGTEKIRHMFLLAKVRGFGLFLIVGHELVRTRAAYFRFLAVIKECRSAISRAAADQARRVGFGDGGIFVRAVERPMHGIGRDTMEIAFLAEIAFIFNEEPNL